MSPRITINTTANGELQVWVNEAGRDLLIEELRKLSRGSDHFHLSTDGTAEVRISGRPYRDGDRVISSGQVLFRPDDWDREHYPHVMWRD